MARYFLIPFMMILLAGNAAGQVVVSDNPDYTPDSANYLFSVGSAAGDRLWVGEERGVKINGFLEADSARINGILTVTNDGGSFQWFPNKAIPGPVHDLLRVSTRRYTIMGGQVLSIPWWPWSVWITQPLIAMGVNTETPNNILDVNGGDIDVNTSTRGYMIGDQYVLRHKGTASNILVGVNAGLTSTAGNDLTIVGFNAASLGSNLGVQNTFIGSGAGQNVGTGGGLTNDYTFVGYQAGFSTPFGVANTFIGSQAGYAEMGDENVYVGWLSGYNNGSTSHHNTFVGNVSGQFNQTGSNNTFIGIGSGFNNITGNDNVALGASASPAAAGLSNTVALGIGTLVPANDQMILGDNRMRVGIGLNNDVTGPQNKLEIDAGINGMNPTLAGNTGASGLRLRDLHSATATIANPGPGVLSVDAAGDVIYVPASSSGSSVSICLSTPPLNNVMKLVATNTLCETNITDLFPVNNVGINNIAPNDGLDVGLGNGTGSIDINNPSSAYEINDQEVLWHKGNTNNILVGVNAGLSLTGGNFNTFVGSGAGQSVVGGGNYTFVGYNAGFSNTGGNTNTFIGSHAGFSELGDENVFVGWNSGYNNNMASYHNTFVGNVSGANNRTGDNNTFIGIMTGGLNQSGHNNVALGAFAGNGGSVNQSNSIALGSGSQVMNSNQMILGDNQIRAGIGLSGDPSGPQNKLEIDAGINGMNPTLAGNVGASGLRLRDLHDLTLPVANVRNVVLSVDGNGDVILVNASGSSTATVDNGLSTSGPTPGALHLGQSIGAAGDPAQLLDNREIPMYGYNLHFKGDIGVSQDRVEIGDNTILLLTPITGAKLNVQTQTEHTAGLFVNRTIMPNTGDTWGVGGLKLMGLNMENIGVYGYGEVDPLAVPTPLIYTAIGVKGIGVAQSLSGAATIAYGVWGEATDNQTPINFGGYFKAVNAIGNNYAVYGDAGGFSAGSPGNPAGPTYAGYFNGDVYISGFYGPSDRKLKTDINNLQGGLDLVMKLRPVTYRYKQNEFPAMTLPGGKQYGLIAQEVEEILPDLVMNNVNPARIDSEGHETAPSVDFKSMNYQELIPILVQAIQEQQTQIELQQARIEALEKEIGK